MDYGCHPLRYADVGECCSAIELCAFVRSIEHVSNRIWFFRADHIHHIGRTVARSEAYLFIGQGPHTLAEVTGAVSDYLQQYILEVITCFVTSLP